MKIGKIRRICKTCNRVFFIYPSRLKQSKCIYCSCKCSGLATRGKKFTEEHRRKISEALMGHLVTDAIRKKFSIYSKTKIPWNKGIKCPQYSGKNHWNWNGGITSEVKKRTNDIFWKRTAKKVYERDSWTCQECQEHVHKNIQCHHKVPWAISHDDGLDNLVTLCTSCHILVENEYKRGINV